MLMCYDMKLEIVWYLSKENELLHNDDDFVLVFLDKLHKDDEIKIDVFLGRLWHRNDVIFGKVYGNISNYIWFLLNYLLSLQMIQRTQHNQTWKEMMCYRRHRRLNTLHNLTTGRWLGENLGPVGLILMSTLAISLT
jgi:hypothetical protein